MAFVKALTCTVRPWSELRRRSRPWLFEDTNRAQVIAFSTRGSNLSAGVNDGDQVERHYPLFLHTIELALLVWPELKHLQFTLAQRRATLERELVKSQECF